MQAERLKILLDFLEQEPNDPFNCYAVAMEYINIDKNKAKVYLEKLVINHGDYLPSYYHLGAIYVENNDFAKATKTYRQGIDLAQKQGKTNALRELKGAYQQLLDEMEE